ncbi:MAG: gliding motility-associated-like protein [Flavobacteriales bacterium]|jgi:gliding motility-associated-like protein
MRSKSTYLFSLSIFISLSCLAQIPNPSFELNSGMPSEMGEWSLVNAWTNAASIDASPDYFHRNGSLAGDLPETPVALVDPYDGDAIMGFIATGIKGTNKREYLSVELDTHLEPGKKYQVTFNITNGAVTSNSLSGLGSNDLGVGFTVGAPNQISNTPLDITPNFIIQSILYEREWVEFSFSFIANEALSHMTIGVFGNDDDKNIQPMEGTNPVISYYFVDNFRMVEIPVETTAANEDKGGVPEEDTIDVTPEEPAYYIPNAFTPNGDGDNDFFFPIVPSFAGYKFCIYNRWGELLFLTTDVNIGWDGLDRSGKTHPANVYAWELSYDVQVLDGEWITKTHLGSVNLLR